MSFTVDMRCLEAIQERFLVAQSLLGGVIQEAAETVADDSVEALKSASPYDPEPNNGVIPDEEGHLNESFYTGDAALNGVTATVDVKTTEPIKFQYVTQGTQGPIYPVTKKALWWSALSHPVGSVAGQSANPFQEPVHDEIEATVFDIVSPFIHEWLTILIG